MGRPLNKKYFGNRNIGSASTTADNGIGGQGVESISVATAGSFVVSNTYKKFPLLDIAAPALPGGVQATAAVVFEIDTVTYTSGGQTDGDYVAGLSTSITGLGGGAVVNIVEVGNKVTAVNLTGGNRGEFTRSSTFDGTGISTFQVLQAPNAGTDLQIAITFRVKSITILEKGSGYTAVPVLSWSGHTFTGQTTPSGNTPVLTVDTGAIGSSTNQENALSFTAKTTSGGTAQAGDVIKQEASRRYLVKTADGVAQCKLVASDTPAHKEMALVATDANGSTYWVLKLTAHKALLSRRTMSGSYLFATNTQAGWSFDAASTGKVSVANA
jgi:hypothetical protein